MKLILRPVAETDLDELFVQQRDPVANRMAAFGALDPDDRAAFDRRWQRILGDANVTARTIDVDGRVAGTVLLWRDPALDAQEVSYWIGREFWGRGVATEAVRLFIAAVPDRPLYGRAAGSNPGSIRVLEKCGFRPVRVDRDVEATHGRVDEHVLRIDG